jgi:hypothetical protein
MATSGQTIDLIDKLSFPFFAFSIAAEHLALRGRDKRTLGDLLNADDETLSGAQLPVDPLIPMGFEGQDSRASLSMLAGNVAVQLAFAPALKKIDELLFRHRISNVGSRRGSMATACPVGLLLLLGPPLDARSAPPLGQPRLTSLE